MTRPVLNLQTQQQRAATFRALHDSPPLVLANAWDAGSAHLIARVGATAIATSSGAQSWALRSYDAGREQAPVLVEATGYLEHLGDVEAAMLVGVEAVLDWANDGYDVGTVAAALDVVVAAAPGALGHARTWTRHERINGALRDEWVARRRVGQVLHRATEHERAVEQFVRAGSRKDAVAAARAASRVDLTRHLVPAGSPRVQAAAAAVVGAQGDVLPDTAINEVTAALLSLVESSPSDEPFGPEPGKYALEALAALGPRLPVAVAQRVLQIVEPLVPRRQGNYRFFDEEILAVLAAVARSADHDLARRAGEALAEAIGQDVHRAADKVVSLGPDVPRLEAAVHARAEVDDNAARVLAAWDQWHPNMVGATRRVLEHLFAHPVGQQRSNFGIGVGPQRAALFVRAALRASEHTDHSSTESTADEFAGRIDQVVEHLLRWTEDSLDIAESRRTASDALALLADRLTGDTRSTAFARVLAVHDNPRWNPSDLTTHASLHPLSRFRIDVGSEQLPLACLRTAAALASGDETEQVARRLTPYCSATPMTVTPHHCSNERSSLWLQ
jgi:hypothetical protein